MKQKSISSTLRAMKIGAKVKFPIKQYNSLNTIIYRDLAMERIKGHRWSMNSSLDEGVVTVTRVL